MAQTTPLHTRHTDRHARMIEFAGWQMPLNYPGGAAAEHISVRTSAGLFDISHMGRIEVFGSHSADALAHLLSLDVRRLETFQSGYALLCAHDGGILDDVFVYRLIDRWLLVVNAANREQDLAWMRAQAAAYPVLFRDTTLTTAMLALQGPRALEIAAAWLQQEITISRFYAREVPANIPAAHSPLLISRTGYTGEDGIEVICADAAAASVWDGILKAAEGLAIDCPPAGLAARDSLRLEPGFHLYGHELTRETSPAEARLLWACDLNHDFVGRDAVITRRDAARSAPSHPRLASFIMQDPGVPRMGCRVLNSDGQEIGRVCSGLRAPSLGAFAGNAYIRRDFTAPDSEIYIDIRGSAKAARIARRPLYRPSYRSSRLPEPPEFSDFLPRHIGPTEQEQQAMLDSLGCGSMEELLAEAIPEEIRLPREPRLPAAADEHRMQQELREIAGRNSVRTSLIGQGYYGTSMPAVIRRNILENPSWYTQYTPYQAEISQGRLEALLNFQSLIIDLTGLECANASLLDEATAAAEAMLLCRRAQPRSSSAFRFFVHQDCFPQTIEVVIGRAAAQQIHVEVGTSRRLLQLLDGPEAAEFFGALFQYPGDSGAVRIPAREIEALHRHGALAAIAADPLALTLLPEPGSFGADIAVGSTQRFGLPMAFGGPHAAYIAARGDLLRQLPGRLVGLSHDRLGNPGVRLALQTREQHIRRDRATSNICTAQVLPAILASMYAVFHGSEGLSRIAERIRRLTGTLANILWEHGWPLDAEPRFDTITLSGLADEECSRILLQSEHLGFLLRRSGQNRLSFSLDETTTPQMLVRLLTVFPVQLSVPEFRERMQACTELPPELRRRSGFLLQDVFQQNRSETSLQRYIHSLQQRDISLTHAMIPLGSCTMKLNPAVAMEAISLPGFANLHPFAPLHHSRGYADLLAAVSDDLARLTGMSAVTLQPNSGAQGEFTGLMIIRAYLQSIGEDQRDICLVPASAHGTNPASAIMAGFRVETIPSGQDGSIDTAELAAIIAAHPERIAAAMITYPSTHGVFDANIREVTQLIHEAGGQVYLDGANMNAMTGLTTPAAIGADVCHLNLHKTFAIPHGGGGPGVGPVCTAAHLTPFQPSQGGADAASQRPEQGFPPPAPPVSAAPYGSAGILPITYAYIRMMGSSGLRRASEVAILNANYIAAQLDGAYRISYRNPQGRVAHECILDLRELQKRSGISVEDVAKRLMDYGFHAPTMSWPEPGTLMIEPTESESKAEIDRFCEAMLAIREEIRRVEDGRDDPTDNPLRQAPHTLAEVTADAWTHPYPRSTAAFPLPWIRERKFWPANARIDNVYGDRHPVCACPL